MLKVRLQRVGRKNDPSFRVVVTDSQNGPKSGKFIEVLGSYDARKGSPNLRADRIKYWLSVGAQASGTVHNLLVGEKVIEGKKINVLPKRTPIITKTDEADSVDQSKEKVSEEAVSVEKEVDEKIEETKEVVEDDVKENSTDKSDDVPAEVVVEEKEKVETPKEPKEEKVTEEKVESSPEVVKEK